MWKKILITCLFLISILLLLAGLGIRYFNSMWFEEKPNYIYLDKDSVSFPITFGAGKYGEIIEPHDLIKVPVRIAGISQQFYLQWDTGAPHSLIYRKPLNSLLELGFKWEEAKGFLLDVEIEIGNGILAADSFPIFENYGRNFELKDSLQAIKLGTLGADIMAKKISIIDFKNGRIEIHKQGPKWIQKIDMFEPFSFAGRRMMLPAVLDGKTHDLFYDSGSSAFGLITTKGRFEDYSNPEKAEIRHKVNSWGNSLPICHKETDMMMEIGGAKLALGRVSYVDMYTPFQGLLAPFSEIGGWLGNKAFLESKLILDCQKEEFAIIIK